MKSILSFLRATFAGGILFLLPLGLLLMAFGKVFIVLQQVSAPLARQLPDIFFGLDGSIILVLLLIIGICFAAGLLFRSARMKKMIGRIEDNLLSFLPGYSLMKSIASDSVGGNAKNAITPVLLKEGETRYIGFLVEESGGLCTVFIPEAPRYDAGEVKIVPVAWVTKLDVPANKVALSLKGFGIGSLDWIKMEERK
jgi:uncharacterized membrane protein